MNDRLSPRINRLIHGGLLPRVIVWIIHEASQVFEDKRVFEDSCSVLGPAIHILFFFLGCNSLEVLHLGLIVHTFGSISQFSSILGLRSLFQI